MVNNEVKKVIGQKENVDFPALNCHHIAARVDTGAKTTSVHCQKIWLEKIDNERVLCCYFLHGKKKVTRFFKFQQRKITSSNGISENRYVVQVKIKLGDMEKETQVNLTNRSNMKYSVLLGRRFLSPEFLVDVSKSYILTRNKSKK